MADILWFKDSGADTIVWNGTDAVCYGEEADGCCIIDCDYLEECLAISGSETPKEITVTVSGVGSEAACSGADCADVNDAYLFTGGLWGAVGIFECALRWTDEDTGKTVCGATALASLFIARIATVPPGEGNWYIKFYINSVGTLVSWTKTDATSTMITDFCNGEEIELDWDSSIRCTEGTCTVQITG